ncbi:MAG: SDR family NAD(P)-dependent oxidoreductase [Melioribacteraceae bacterium]|jgi:NAD(P)-dependent dehydrogenase (short-subunit alcohol dehydrogenase family)|nr:SDR family NAD(P)-dependent oxidoreductase [Melioribacteraceae bacterium]
MKDKIIIITGANRGIGREAAKELAKSGAKIYMACRSVKSANDAREEIVRETGNENLFVKELDLSSPESIRNFVDSFKKDENKLDILINNAGLWSDKKEIGGFGAERTFAVNVIGHQLLTKLLLEHIKNGTPSRIINVASHFAGGLRIDDINFDKRKYSGTLAYKKTKQANRMLTREWARRLEKDGVSVYSMTPGFIPSTDLFRNQNIVGKLLLKLFGLIEGRTIQHGADTIVWLASTEKILGNNGGFFKDRIEEKCKFFNPADEKKLWDKCEEFLARI